MISALEGIRRMMVLVWSKEQGVKDAVVAAYKRLYLNPQGGTQRYVLNPSPLNHLTPHLQIAFQKPFIQACELSAFLMIRLIFNCYYYYFVFSPRYFFLWGWGGRGLLLQGLVKFSSIH